MKISKDEIRWGERWLKPKYRKKDLEPFYFMWFWIDKDMASTLEEDAEFKRFGLFKFWHDHPHAQLNLWFFGFAWSSPWTRMNNNE